MSKTKRVSAGTRWWPILQLFVFSLCVVVVGDTIEKIKGAPVQVAFMVSFGLLYAAWWPLIFIHELGHAVFARLAGWRVPVIAVRGFTIWTDSFRVRHGLPAFAVVGGATVILPPPGSDWRDWRPGYIFILTGGAVANFSLAAILGIGATSATGLVLSRFLGTTAFLSGFTGICNLLPVRWHRWRRTDGAMIWDAIRGEDLQAWGHYTHLFEDKVRLKRPRDWNRERAQVVQSDIDAGNAVGSGALFEYHLDSGNLEAARKALSCAEGEYGPSDSIQMAKAFFIAYADNDPKAAEATLARISSRASKRLPDYWRAVAAIEAARGDAVAVEGALRRARAGLRRAPLASEFAFEILNRIEARVTVAPSGSEGAVATT